MRDLTLLKFRSPAGGGIIGACAAGGERPPAFSPSSGELQHDR
jgi:hypothetical protein